MKGLVFFLLFAVINVGFPQSQFFDKIGKKDGLPDNDILTMVQDDYGHLWFGTSNGLSLYNGYSFRTWRHEQDDSTSLPDNQVEILMASSSHSLLVGFINLGIFKFDYQKELFVPLDKTQKNPHKKWHCAYNTKDGNIWIGSSDGLELYDAQSERLTKVPITLSKQHFITGISEDTQGCLWLMCSSNTIAKYNPKTHETKEIKLHPIDKGLLNRGGRIMYDPAGYVWVGTEYYGLFKYRISDGSVSSFSIANGKLKSNIVLCFLKDKHQVVWMGTDNGGLYSFQNSVDEHPKCYMFDINSEYSLSSNTVYALEEVDPELMLIGTYAGGLNIINDFRHKFSTYSDKGPKGFCLSQRSALSFHKGNNGKILIGTDGGGVNQYDPKTGKYNYFTKENGKLPHSNVAKSIFIDSRNRIWVGSWAGGVAVFDSNLIHLKTFSISNIEDQLGSDHIWCITEDHDHQIWLGTYNNGIEKISADLSLIEHYHFYTKGHNGLKSSRIFQMAVDPNGTIWATSETLHYFDPKTNRFKEYTYPNMSFPSNLRDICVDKKGNLWVGTSDGIFFKVPSDVSQKPVLYPASDGWFGNAVLSLQDDQYGNIWLATDVGISCLKLSDGSSDFLNFDMHDGVQTGQFNQGAKCRDDEGYIYFGGTVGFHRFHPDHIRLNTHLPKVSISDIRVFNQPLSTLPKYNKNRAVFWNDSTIYFHYEDKMISIEFAGLDFVLPEKNRFAYILEGFDHNWNYSHAGIHIATYTNLDPGSYVFKVKAANNDGKWNYESSKINLVILPPWWETWWFRTVVIGGLISGLLGFYFWRTRSIRKRNEELKNEVESQTNELRQMNGELGLLYKELTESIQAAQVIQTAILPSNTVLEDYFGHIAIFYKPKDVVSGDFYWCARSGNRFILAVVDCTGHGVAGAFMTFIGYETLNQIIRENVLAEAGQIVSLLNQEIITSMNRYQSGMVNAGMDVSLCIYDKDNNTLQFAGANNPLYLVRKNELFVYKGDKQGVGGKQKTNNYQFQTTYIPIERKDQIYLFSDGYADQLGGKDGNEKFMYPKFRQTLLDIVQMDVKNRISFLEKVFEVWRNGYEQLDDVLVIGFDIT